MTSESIAMRGSFMGAPFALREPIVGRSFGAARGLLPRAAQLLMSRDVPLASTTRAHSATSQVTEARSQTRHVLLRATRGVLHWRCTADEQQQRFTSKGELSSDSDARRFAQIRAYC